MGLLEHGLATVYELIASRMVDAPPKPLIVGICGAQGSGKSTLSARVAQRLIENGCSAAVLSIDDLYLTAREREALAQRVHPLLRTRGVPGTHDIELGIAILESLRAHRSVRLPRFDKASDDRSAYEAWPLIDPPLDVLLFEGWCIGARPQADGALAAPLNALEARCDADGRWRRYVNERLREEYRALFAYLDVLVFIAAPSFDIVRHWRCQQEHELIGRLQSSASHPAAVMNDAQIDQFVQHFERLTLHMLDELPGRAHLTLKLDEERALLNVATPAQAQLGCQ